MRRSLVTGIGFGLTSGVITTLGLIVGLYSGTKSTRAVIGGILIIAVADSLADALGMHVAEESKNQNSIREIWEATGATLVAKLLVTLTFLVPVVCFGYFTAITVSVVWGLLLIGFFSYYIARGTEPRPWVMVLEHFAIAIVVIIAAHFIGLAVSGLVE